VGSGILIFLGPYMLFDRLYKAILYNISYNKYFWAVQRPRRAHEGSHTTPISSQDNWPIQCPVRLSFGGPYNSQNLAELVL
jgi:hypothetical protein